MLSLLGEYLEKNVQKVQFHILNINIVRCETFSYEIF